MKETKFRGKRIDNDEWITGYYVKGVTRHCILKDLGGIQYDVHPESIGEYIGSYDTNNKKIFEGDIVEIFNWGIENYSIGIAQIIWDKEELGFRISPTFQIEDSYDLIKKCLPRCKIIGNIYENGNLINGKYNI